MKRTIGISAFLFVCAAGAFAQQLDFIFEANFEDEAIGKPPKDWKTTPVGKIEVVKSGDPKYGNVVRFVDTGEGSGMSREFNIQKAGVISIEFDIYKIAGTGGDVELLYVSNSRLSELTGVDGKMTNGDPSTFMYHDGAAWQQGPAFTLDEWHRISYRIDLDKEKWSVELDGEKLGSNLGFRDFAGEKGLNRLNVANILDGGSTYELWMDNIVVYPRTTRPTLAVSPAGKLAIEWAKLKRAKGV